MKPLFLAGWVGFALFVLVAAAPACGGALHPVGPQVIAPATLAAKDAICVLSKLGEPVAQILDECKLPEDLAQAVIDLMGEARREGVSVTVTSGAKR